jgi:hypothetical protein
VPTRRTLGDRGDYLADPKRAAAALLSVTADE